jgi:copper homeostasis protein
MDLTFHRAFDRIADRDVALEQLIELGFNRILTSGGALTAIEGAAEIKRLVQRSTGRISIMPGAGIHAGNIRWLAVETGAKEFHGSASAKLESMMTDIYSSDLITDDQQLVIRQTDQGEAERMVSELKKL